MRARRGASGPTEFGFEAMNWRDVKLPVKHIAITFVEPTKTRDDQQKRVMFSDLGGVALSFVSRVSDCVYGERNKSLRFPLVIS